MVKLHLKRINAPRTWKIKRKGIKFIMRPDPGQHSLSESIPLGLVLRDMLGIVKTKKEARYLVKNNDVLVDGKKHDKLSFPVGLFDILSIKQTNDAYRLVLNKRGDLCCQKIDVKESIKPCKIAGKTVIKKGKIQLNFVDGKNVLIEKDEYKTGDTLVVEVPDLKIKEHLKFEKGVYVFLTGGKHIGAHGVIEDIKEDKIIFKSKDESVETLKKYAYVIGKGKPSIKINDENE